MGTCLVALTLVALSANTQPPSKIDVEEREYQDENFQRWWSTDFVWTFDDLPTTGSVPAYRIPWTGHDYPDVAGGTIDVMRKYDRAFHGGRTLATAFEQMDTTSNKERTVVRGRLLGILRFPVERTPNWHGHCNGWASAVIRHAEPAVPVVRNGVTFTPADIKGLLAEIYMYNHSEFLGGVDPAINPGTLHAVLANWIGRGTHPVAMDTALGREVFNYPIYAYASASAKRSETMVEVKTHVAYTMSSDREYDRSQHLHRFKRFHYTLDLDDQGAIVGGYYHPGSDQIDMLWVPLHAAASGEEGNEKGNPHIEVGEVLDIWRESVPEEARNRWLNIDPLPEDAIQRATQQQPTSEQALEQQDQQPDDPEQP